MSPPSGHNEKHLLAVVRTAADAIVSADATGVITSFNPAAERIFGHPAAAAVGRPLTMLMPERFHSAHEAGLARFLATRESRIVGNVVEVVGLRQDGTEFPVELSLAAWEEDGAAGFTGILRDITERKRLEVFAACDRAVTGVIAENPPLEDALTRLIAAVACPMGWQVGAIWTSEDGTGELRCAALWQEPELGGDFATTSMETSFARGVGLPGRVWDSGRPAWLRDVIVDDNFPRSAAAKRSGLHAGVALPLTDGSAIIGVIEFFSRRLLRPDEAMLDLFATIGRHVGQFMVRRWSETARAQAEDGLSRSEQRFRALATLAPAGIFETDAAGACLFVNDRWCELSGLEASAALGDGWAQALHPQDRARVYRDWHTAVDEDGESRSEYRYCRPDGVVSWVLGSHVPLHDESGAVTGYLGSCVDITERKRMEEQLRHMADRDPLTGLLNRRGFTRELERHAALQRRYGPEGALLAIDVDGFKQVNDRLGHLAGDRVLARLADILCRRLRGTDVIARVGGDEFAVILPRAGEAEAQTVARSLVDGIRTELAAIDGQVPMSVTASVGIALFDVGDVTGERMLGRADQALYAAKAAGRNGFALYAR
jgi:diguanylate cyclase (GGDEF)-like protein/PAS domain S-box-containing protein